MFLGIANDVSRLLTICVFNKRMWIKTNPVNRYLFHESKQVDVSATSCSEQNECPKHSIKRGKLMPP